MNLARRGLKLNLNKDECKSISLITLWKCLQSFDENKGNFKSYLKRSIRNNLIKENKKTNFVELRDIYTVNPVKISLDSLSLAEQQLIKQKYFGNYTLKELGNMYNCTGENIRIRLNKIIEKLKHDYLNGV